MSHKPERQFPDDLGQVYSRLNQLDVEQFYAGYQWWITHQRINALQEEIDTLRLQIDENAEYMQYARPPAVALATLARLQANGVDDLDLLDRMLEQGEEWLDLIMQRLDYCEQLDFIDDNYTQWCEHALEGAYDWIDSMREAGVDTSPLAEASSDIEATEELFLRKLTSEEEEEIPTMEPPPAETQLAGEALFESISSQVAQVSPPEEMSEEPGEQEMAQPLLAETTALADASLISGEEDIQEQVIEATGDVVDSLAVSMVQESEQQLVELASVPEVSLAKPEAEVPEPTTAIEQAMEEQGIEAVQAPEAAHVAEENGPSTASFEEESEQVLTEQAAKSPSTIEASPPLEGNAGVETLEVLANEGPPQEDTGVDAVQEMPFPVEIDSVATAEEPLPAEIDEQYTTGEAHSEEKELEATAGSEVPLPEEVNVESEVPVEEKLTGATEESVEESPVVAAALEESASEEREDAEHAPIQDQKPKRRRSFWEFLLGLPGR
jgi:hypothetical protein